MSGKGVENSDMRSPIGIPSSHLSLLTLICLSSPIAPPNPHLCSLSLHAHRGLLAPLLSSTTLSIRWISLSLSLSCSLDLGFEGWRLGFGEICPLPGEFFVFFLLGVYGFWWNLSPASSSSSPSSLTSLAEDAFGVYGFCLSSQT